MENTIVIPNGYNSTLNEFQRYKQKESFSPEIEMPRKYTSISLHGCYEEENSW